MGPAEIRKVYQSEDMTAEFLANPSDLPPVFFFQQNPLIGDYGRKELISIQFLKLLSYRLEEVVLRDQKDQPPLYNAYFEVGYVDQAGSQHTFAFEARSQFGTEYGLVIINPNTFSNQYQSGDEISVNFGFSSGGTSRDKIRSYISTKPPDQSARLFNRYGSFGDDPISFEQAKGLFKVDGEVIPSDKLIVETISKP